jgi:hypothetical protein
VPPASTIMMATSWPSPVPSVARPATTSSKLESSPSCQVGYGIQLPSAE